MVGVACATLALTVPAPPNASELNVRAELPPLPLLTILEESLVTVVEPTVPVPSSVPPLTEIGLLLSEPVTASLPPLIVVGPVYVLIPERVSDPVPAFVSASLFSFVPVPPRTPTKVSLVVLLTVSVELDALLADDAICRAGTYGSQASDRLADRRR